MTEKNSNYQPFNDLTIIEHLNWQLDVNAALAELYKCLSSPEMSIEEITHVILQQAKILTESEHGFVSLIDQETGDNIGYSLTGLTLGKKSHLDEPIRRIIFPPMENGIYPRLWGHAFNTRKPFYTNTPQTYPSFDKGFPLGHIPLERFIAFPVLVENELAGMIALANPRKDYNDRDLMALQRLAEFFTLAIQRKRTADILRLSEEKYRKLFDDATDGIVLTDVQTGKIIDCNTSICVLVEWEKHELVGKSQEILYPPLDAKGRVPGILHLIQLNEKEYPRVIETQVITRSGKIRDVSIKGNLLELGGKNVLQEIFRDITEKKQVDKDLEKYREHLEELVRERAVELSAAHERLRQSQKIEAIGTLAGGIAHDFNNILGVIIGYTELIEDDLAAGSNAKNNITHILTAAYRAKEMVNKLLTFSKKTKAERRLVHFNEIIKDAVEFLKSTLPGTIQIYLSLEEKPALLLANPAQILQIVLNIANNAIYAMKEKGGILNIELNEINCCFNENEGLAPGKYLHLVISDNGHGMGPEILKRIFEPFFTSKNVGEGTGMGLAVVHGIVQGHGGCITVNSEPGKGTVVHVYLPASPPL